MRRSAVLLLPLAVACARETQTPADTAAPVTQAAPAAPASGLLGTYTVTLSERDFPATAPQALRKESVGTWALAFQPDNRLVVTHNGRRVVEGPYQVRGNEVTFATGETGAYACNTPATYTWQLGNGQLTFNPVGQDTCQGRVLAITSRPFTRQP
jgi:hypothetical protein